MKRYVYSLVLVLLVLLLAIPFAAAQQLPPNGDYDKDGVINSQDACPAKGDQGYGLKPNGCPKEPPPPPPDSDGDGIIDSNDACPNEGDLGNGLLPNGCPIRDDDGDGIANANDACPNEGNLGYGLLPNGCPIRDDDGDGVANTNDECPNQGDLGNGLLPNGCPIRDDDGDGVANANDSCPNQGDIGNGLLPNGCPIRDDDGDGVANINDECPNQGDLGNGLRPNGCPILDDDGDGVANANDECPNQGGTKENNGCPSGETSNGEDTNNDAPTIEVIGEHVVCTGEDDSENCLIDTDEDGIPDLVDACPRVAGDPYFRGCSAPPDKDGDGVPDPRDRCDNAPGPEDNAGCPLDLDNDGVPNEIDQCIIQPGPINNSGCPLDTDGDGLIGFADRCPDLFAETEDGCPTSDAMDTTMCYVTTQSAEGIPTYDGLESDAAIVGHIYANQIYSVIGMGSNFVRLADGSFAPNENLIPSTSCLNKVQDSLALRESQAEATAEPEPEATTEPTSETEEEVFFIYSSITVVVTPDTDKDGLTDDVDTCPYDFGKTPNGCPDTDGDGTTDDVDLCVEYPGAKDKGGCPDRDNDGVYDFEDGCPLTVGDVHGCPDSDGDGIGDNVDFCRDLAGVKANWGCPPDNDGDGVYNKDDACPNEFGVNPFGSGLDEYGQPMVFDGCPQTIIIPTITIVDEDNDGIPDYEDDCVCESDINWSVVNIILGSDSMDGSSFVPNSIPSDTDSCVTDVSTEQMFNICGTNDSDGGVLADGWDAFTGLFDDSGAEWDTNDCGGPCGQTGG